MLRNTIETSDGYEYADPMNKLMIALLCGFGLVALAGAGVYFASEAVLRDVSYDAPFDHPIPTDAASIERGRYIARTRGCFGCHGQQLQGMNFDEQWDWPARAIAPNLARYAREHDIAALEAAIRQGISAEGRAMLSMPSFNFARLSDADLADLIAFLRSAPMIDLDLPSPRLGWSVRWELLTVPNLHVEDWADHVPELTHDHQRKPALARGEYLAMTTCNECHGLDLRGDTLIMGTPDLAIVRAIDRDTFETIIRTGRGLGDRHLGLMSLVAPDRFSEMTEQDVDDLYHFLSTLGTEPAMQDVFWRP